MDNNSENNATERPMLSVEKLPIKEILLTRMINEGASDLYITYGSIPAYRVEGQVKYIGERQFDDQVIDLFIRSVLNEEQIDDFESTLELNTAISWNDARFRINVFKQQQHNALVVRRLQTYIPTIDSLALPEIYKDLSLQKRGLILMVGATGSGKSTSLASMIDYRNKNSSGHIITIEDPIEYIHSHNKSVISQRDVGIDTYSFGMALKNALRQQPDVILIGEIRDSETMEHALNFSETGHLCLATLHANNANQAVERVLSFFSDEKQKQVMMSLAINLKAILSQRLIPSKDDKRAAAVEVLINQGVIKDMIQSGNIKDIKEVMDKNSDIGMQTFDRAVYELYEQMIISEEDAIAYADNQSQVRMMIMQKRQTEMGGSHSLSSGNTSSSASFTENKSDDF